MEATTKTQRSLESLARWIVLLSVMLAPWLFGGAEPWAYLLLSLSVLTGVAVWLFAGIGAGGPTLRAPAICCALLLLAGYVAFQRTALPSAIVRRINPLATTMSVGSHNLVTQSSGDSQDIEQALAASAASSNKATLSLSVPATSRSLILFLAYLGTFLVLSNTTREWSHLRLTASVLVGSAFLMSVSAVVHKFSGSEEIYWMHTPRYGGNVYGPFSNRNHLAAHLNMVLGLAFGLLLSSRRFYQAMAWPDLRDRIAMLSSRDGARTMLRAFAVLIITGAVAVSVSRGALLSLAVTSTIFGAVLLWRRRGDKRLFIGFMVPMLLIIATILWFGSSQLVERMGSLADVMQNPFTDLRYIVMRDCLDMVAAAPLFGTGFGTFEHVYGGFQTPPLTFRWLHAHNDWLQLVVEGGLVGALLFGCALALWLRYIQRWLPRAGESGRLMVTGILFGLTTIAFHSLFDYSLHKPANAFLMAGLAGLAVAGVHVRRNASQATAPSQKSTNTRPMASAFALLAIVGIIVILISLQLQLRGALAYQRVTYLNNFIQHTPVAVTRAAALDVGLTDAQSVLRWGGEDADTLMDVCDALLAWAAMPDLPANLEQQLIGTASQTATAAVRSAPTEYLAWLWLARIYMAQSHWDDADLALSRSRQLVKHPEQVRMFDVSQAPADDRQIP